MNKVTGTTNESLKLSNELDLLFENVSRAPICEMIDSVVEVAGSLGLPLSTDDLNLQLREL